MAVLPQANGTRLFVIFSLTSLTDLETRLWLICRSMPSPPSPFSPHQPLCRKLMRQRQLVFAWIESP